MTHQSTCASQGMLLGGQRVDGNVMKIRHQHLGTIVAADRLDPGHHGVGAQTDSATEEPACCDDTKLEAS